MGFEDEKLNFEQYKKLHGEHFVTHMAELKCPWCNKIFTIEKRQCYLYKNAIFTGCCGSCSTKFDWKIKKEGMTEENKKLISDNIIRFFARRKGIEGTIEELMEIYIKEKESKKRFLNGYTLIYKPEHPKAIKSSNYSGCIYEHVYVVENFIGRYLKDDENVHHIDHNRSNNNLKNLQLMTRSEHSLLHGKEKSISVEFKCEKCGIIFTTNRNKIKKYCSKKCVSKVQNKPTYLELQNLMLENSISAIGRMFNVDGNSVRKWIKKYQKEMEDSNK